MAEDSKGHMMALRKQLQHAHQRGVTLASVAWGRTSRRMRLAAAVALGTLVLYLTVTALPAMGMPLPTVSLQYQAQASKFNASKVALLIENRPVPVLAPLMLHFISVVPPDWRFRFMGSPESVAAINSSVAIRSQVAAGKLDLTYIPANMSTGSQEEISRFLTTLWVYETLLAPAEWLLIFQTDSMLCANSRRTLNEYLDYDWVGAPWHPEARFGGNGGLSLRRVSAIAEILRNQVRLDGSEPEDVWLTDRLGHRPGARLANGTISTVFSGESFQGEAIHIERRPQGKNCTAEAELMDKARAGAYVEGIDDWREGFYEPMGYHTGGSGKWLNGGIWGSPSQRKHIWDYCPEMKMTLEMDAAQFVPGDCNANWKRSDASTDIGHMGPVTSLQARGYPTEIIDGEEYPLLNVMPWA